MQLLRFELYKIFSQKIIYITFLLLMVLSTGFSFSSVTDTEKNLYNQWKGILTKEKVQQAERGNSELMKKQDALKPGRVFSESDQVKMGIYETIALGQNAEKHFSQKLNALQNKKDKKSNLEAALIRNVDLSYFSYKNSPMKMIDFVNFFSFAITGAMLLIGLSSIYSREYSSGVDHYILSSKKGRKSLVWSKISAALIYTFAVVIAWELCSLVINYIQYGKEGWGTAIQYIFEYFFSPYPLNMFDYHLIQLGIHIIGAFGFTLIILLISSISRNSLITFFISGFILIVPLIMYEMIHVEWLRDLLSFSFIYIMKVQVLFENFKTVNLFGLPVLYPIFAVILMTLLSFIFIVINLRVMKNKEVVS